ncbi:hypothetical protein KSP40_PGU018039 [Platanthera guangdongensis]|uniref:Nucleoside diphosphate kinase n=1 Tax=Platanthera guangdongensis TaxID=2320717 RepID=A0ABR2M4G5_9ASPA
MSYQICRSASRAARSLLSASKGSAIPFEGRAIAAIAANKSRERYSSLSSLYENASDKTASNGWLSAALTLPAAVYMLQEKETHAAEFERTFIAIKPDGVQRGLVERYDPCLHLESRWYQIRNTFLPEISHPKNVADLNFWAGFLSCSRALFPISRGIHVLDGFNGYVRRFLPKFPSILPANPDDLVELFCMSRSLLSRSSASRYRSRLRSRHQASSLHISPVITISSFSAASGPDVDPSFAHR